MPSSNKNDSGNIRADFQKHYLGPAEAVAAKIGSVHAQFQKAANAIIAPPPPGLNAADLAAHADYVKILKKDLDLMDGAFNELRTMFKHLKNAH
jgi:hypothetical protein